MTKIKEEDLFHPLKQYLEKEGYEVRAEVKGCDITASKGDELIIIEMKKNLSVRLLAQAALRQKITPSVYVCVPYSKNIKDRKKFKEIKHLLRRLELGLITVSDIKNKPLIEILFHPSPFTQRKNYKKKRAVLKEISARKINFNKGGRVNQKIITAYRINAVEIAVYLRDRGAMKPKELRALGTGDKTREILYNNHYGWFYRVERGVYDLTEKGKEDLIVFKDVVKEIEKSLNA